MNRNGFIECRDCGESLHIRHATNGLCNDCIGEPVCIEKSSDLSRICDDIHESRAELISFLRTARLCSTYQGRKDWLYFARVAGEQLKAARAEYRRVNESMRFGAYMQRELAHGVWKLEAVETV